MNSDDMTSCFYFNTLHVDDAKFLQINEEKTKIIDLTQ